MKIDSEFHALIPPLADEERQGLEESLLREGCRDALVLWGDVLIDGHNRYEICKAHDIHFETVCVPLADRDEAQVWIIRNQFGRRNLAPYARAELALKLEPLLAAKAKEKQAAGGLEKVPQDSSEPPSGRETRTQVAKAAGVSHDTIAKAKKIQAEADAETKERLRRGDTTINAEHKKIQKTAERKKSLAKIAAEPEPLPDGPFRVIVVDPPWEYHKRADDATHRSANPYATMSLDAIRALPVEARAHDDAVLWLWTTNAHLEHSFGIARAWGFEPKTILTWAKHKMGLGDWLRGKTEHCLMCVRGRPTITLTNQTTLLTAPAREHSRKPEEFYTLVEALCPGGKMEMFARERRDGWEAWGAEKGLFDGE